MHSQQRGASSSFIHFTVFKKVLVLWPSFASSIADAGARGNTVTFLTPDDGGDRLCARSACSEGGCTAADELGCSWGFAEFELFAVILKRNALRSDSTCCAVFCGGAASRVTADSIFGDSERIPPNQPPFKAAFTLNMNGTVPECNASIPRRLLAKDTSPLQSCGTECSRLCTQGPQVRRD